MYNRKRDILFHIENEVQFDSLKPLLLHLRDNTNITFDIVVPDDVSNGTIVNKEVHDGGAKAVSTNGFEVIRSVDSVVLPKVILDTKYQVFLSAYMYQWHYQNLNVKYRIMFPYASYYLNKPNWTIEHFMNEDYRADALLSHAIGTKPVTDIFTKTYIVPPLKLMDFCKKSKKNKKPILFFAPTYNEIDFAPNLLKSIDEIKKYYTVIMRGHHRVIHIGDKKNISKMLYNKADKIYDMEECDITVPLAEADIVLSDNSAVIFDAIYCGVPVTLFSKDPNSFHYRDINTIQSEFVKDGDVLWSNNHKEILGNINNTFTPTMIKRQEQLRKKLFPEHSSDPVAQWMDVLKIYLEDTLPPEYYFTKKYWVDRISSLYADSSRARELEATLNSVNNDLNLIRAELSTYLGIKRSARLLLGNILRKIRINKK